MQWIDPNTKPKPFKPVLVSYTPHRKKKPVVGTAVYCVNKPGSYDGEEGWFLEDDDLWCDPINPTGWMPRPEPMGSPSAGLFSFIGEARLVPATKTMPASLAVWTDGVILQAEEDATERKGGFYPAYRLKKGKRFRITIELLD